MKPRGCPRVSLEQEEIFMLTSAHTARVVRCCCSAINVQTHTPNAHKRSLPSLPPTLPP